jgi:hypothetical protein
MPRTTATHVAAGVGGAGVGFTVDRLLDHGTPGLFTFGVLAIAAMFFGWLSSRPVRRRDR